jgi:O-6-methylguanine DNA methyltransferase
MEKVGSGVSRASIRVGGERFDVLVTTDGISRLIIPPLLGTATVQGRCRPEMGMKEGTCRAEAEWLEMLAHFLADFLSGRKPGCPPAVDLSGLSDFTVEVLAAVSRIPWGSRRSYGWVAARISRPSAARAIGGALGRNPVPILIPCHRVVRADGSPGGYSSGGGWKQRLGYLEGHNWCTVP